MTREQALARAREELGVGIEDTRQRVIDGEEIAVDYAEDGHSGPGWYAWFSEYPEEGSVRIGD